MGAVKEALLSNQPRQPEVIDTWPDDYLTDEQLQEMGEFYDSQTKESEEAAQDKPK